MIAQALNLILQITDGMGYWGIVFLMAIESSIFPLPSELVIPPAGYLVQQGKMNWWLVILAGSIGSWLGALANYCLAFYLGRKIVYKIADSSFASWFFINSEKIKKSENFFLEYGRASTFFGRLVPVIRHLISIPAGFAKMNIVSFSVYTLLGSAIWVSVLTVVGYFLGANKELLESNLKIISYSLAIVSLVFFLFLIYFRKRKKTVN